MEIISHPTPKLKMPSFNVDTKLSPGLDKFAITSLMNKSHVALFLGKPASGKTSLLVSLLQTKNIFCEVFETIIVAMPPNSRASLNDSIFGGLDDSHIYDDINLAILQEIYQGAMNRSKEGEFTLLILDDMQSRLKGPCEQYLKHMICNRRYARLSIWLAVQTYKSIPVQIRMTITSLFIFRISKNEMKSIFDELIEQHKDKFEHLLETVLYKHDHDFLFIDTNSQRLFNNWNQEIRFIHEN